ncbi:MAG: hypothetical protein FJ368_00425 [Pelagibacterales bacterium]|nr:hypothetical protein [Pelagibacterales bacterium]
MILVKNFIKFIAFSSLIFAIVSCRKEQVAVPYYPTQNLKNSPYYYNRYPVNYNPNSRYYNRPYNVNQPRYRGYYQDFDNSYVAPYGYENYNSDNIKNNAILDKQ